MAQLTPNYLVNIFGFISKCELNDITPSFPAFARLLSIVPSTSASQGWFTLYSRKSFMTVVGKSSSCIWLKTKWSINHIEDTLLRRRLNCWNLHPRYILSDEILQPLHLNVWRVIKPLFEAEMYREFPKWHAWVPTSWLPHVDQFSSRTFLSTIGLCAYKPRGSLLYMLLVLIV